MDEGGVGVGVVGDDDDSGVRTWSTLYGKMDGSPDCGRDGVLL